MEININTQDILKRGLKLNQLETDIPIYDKYSLTFTLNNGERKTIFLYADKNSIAKNTPIEETFPEIYRQTQFSEKTFKEALKIEKSEPVLKAVKHYALGAIHGLKKLMIQLWGNWKKTIVL